MLEDSPLAQLAGTIDVASVMKAANYLNRLNSIIAFIGTVRNSPVDPTVQLTVVSKNHVMVHLPASVILGALEAKAEADASELRALGVNIDSYFAQLEAAAQAASQAVVEKRT